MFEMAIYFVLFYMTIAIVSGFVLRHIRRQDLPTSVKRKRKQLVWLLLLLPLLPYAFVSCQTTLFGSLLLPATHEALRYDDDGQRIVSYKVLYISPWDAQVYVILHEPTTDTDYDLQTRREYPSGYQVGYTVDLIHTSHGWTHRPSGGFEVKDCVWSDVGSADGNVFPPYPEDDE